MPQLLAVFLKNNFIKWIMVRRLENTVPIQNAAISVITDEPNGNI
jgi:hypothetical protein